MPRQGNLIRQGPQGDTLWGGGYTGPHYSDCTAGHCVVTRRVSTFTVSDRLKSGESMIQQQSTTRFALFETEVFQSNLNAICGAFDVQAGRTVAGSLAVSHCGGLDIAQVGLNAPSVVRTAANIRQDPGNHFFLIMQQSGRAYLSQNGTSATVKPGDLFLVDSARECQFHYCAKETSLQLSLHLPRDEMTHRFGQRIYGGMAIDGRDALALAMKSTLTKLIATNEPMLQVRVREAFYSVFGALLAERAQGRNSVKDNDQYLVQCAMSLIAEHYASPDVSTQSLADLLGVSIRRLQRAFKTTGEKPSERIQRYRVEAVRNALTAQQKCNTRSITSIAYSCGFSDLSTFYRHYKSRFGCTPAADRNNLPVARCNRT